MEFRMPKRGQNSHKGTFGRVLNVSGSDYMSGAALLSSLSALRVGCGYVFLCSTERVITAVSAQTQNIVFAPLEDLENQVKNADVLLVGCGLSTSDEAVGIFESCLKNVSNIPVIIDADGLNILAKGDYKNLPEKLIFTPHPKEAARLLGLSVEEILRDTKSAACSISEKYGCVTVLKTHRTVVCSKGFEIYENETGNSSLAKAGSGDVLAGIIAGLVAQKCDIFYGAKLGVYLHGLCGELVSKELTEYGVLAIDQVEYIPKAIKMIV